MKSAIAVTTEIDDVELAAGEILKSINSQLVLEKNSCGVLYYDDDIDGGALAALISDALGVEIVGCSAIATLDNKEGYKDMAAMFMLLTADDCEFATVASESAKMENLCERLANAVNAAKADMSENPKLALVLVPRMEDIGFDAYLDGFSEKIGYIPVIGGVSTGFSGECDSVVYKGELYQDRAVAMLISGNIQPVFSIAGVLSPFSERKGVITRSEGPTLYEVDGRMSFVDYIEGQGLNVETLIPNAENNFFQNYPLLIEGPEGEENGLPYVRVINTVDFENGSGSAYGSLPQKSIVSLAVLTREDIRKSVKNSMEELRTKIESNKDYKYSTVLCASCAARRHIMNPLYNEEGVSIVESMPKGLNMIGFYSHGELCPVYYSDYKAKNQFHNATIVFCAF